MEDPHNQAPCKAFHTWSQLYPVKQACVAEQNPVCSHLGIPVYLKKKKWKTSFLSFIWQECPTHFTQNDYKIIKTTNKQSRELTNTFRLLTWMCFIISSTHWSQIWDGDMINVAPDGSGVS